RRTPLGLRERLDRLQPFRQLCDVLLDVGRAADALLQRVELRGFLGDAGRQIRFAARDMPPPSAEPDGGDPGEDAEHHPELALGDGEAKCEVAALLVRRSEVDPNHVRSSPGRRSPRPTATASAAPPAATASAYGSSTRTRSNGRATSTGIPQFDARY